MPNEQSDKSAEDDKKSRSNTETARRIWLAGVGAYGRAFTEAQEALKDVTGKGSAVFDDLVQKGAMMEKVVEVKGKDMMGKASIPSFDMPNFDIDDRIKSMRSRLSRGADTDTDMDARLTAVEAKLDKILAILEPKKPAKKTSTKKASAKRTQTKKTPIKKAPAKKKPVLKA